MAWRDLTQREKNAAICKIYGLTAVTADAGDYSYGLFMFGTSLTASTTLTKLTTNNPTATVRQVSPTEIVGLFKMAPMLIKVTS